LAKGPEFLGRVVTHPRQLKACEVIADLIDRLRSLRSEDRDFYEFQRRLFGVLYEAEERRAEATRNVKRQRRGKQIDPAPFGDWELEQVVMDRIVRQVRTMGDALAWRAFGFDRRIVIALAQNPRPGISFGKEGLG
jgi:hypothetical protein